MENATTYSWWIIRAYDTKFNVATLVQDDISGSPARWFIWGIGEGEFDIDMSASSNFVCTYVHLFVLQVRTKYETNCDSVPYFQFYIRKWLRCLIKKTKWKVHQIPLAETIGLSNNTGLQYCMQSATKSDTSRL